MKQNPNKKLGSIWLMGDNLNRSFNYIRVLRVRPSDYQQPFSTPSYVLFLPTSSAIRAILKHEFHERISNQSIDQALQSVIAEANRFLRLLKMPEVIFEPVHLHVETLSFKDSIRREIFNLAMFGGEPTAKDIKESAKERVFAIKSLPQTSTVLASQGKGGERVPLFTRVTGTAGEVTFIPIGDTEIPSKDPKAISESVRNALNRGGLPTYDPSSPEDKPPVRIGDEDVEPDDLQVVPAPLKELILELRRVCRQNGGRFVKPEDLHGLGRDPSKIISDAIRDGHEDIVSKYIERKKPRYRFRAEADWTKPPRHRK